MKAAAVCSPRSLGQLSAQQILMTPGSHYRLAYRLREHLRAV